MLGTLQKKKKLDLVFDDFGLISQYEKNHAYFFGGN